MRKWEISKEDENFLRKNFPKCIPFLDEEEMDAVLDCLDDQICCEIESTEYGTITDFGNSLEQIRDNIFWDNVIEIDGYNYAKYSDKVKEMENKQN